MIRLGRKEEVAAIVELERGLPTAPHWAAREYSEAAAQGRLFVAEDRGELVGFAVGALSGDEAELESVGVRGEWQGRGRGLALVEAVAAWAGGRAMMLEVRAGSAGARRVYERAGFRQVGLRPGYYANPADDAVVMRREGCLRAEVAGRNEGEV